MKSTHLIFIGLIAISCSAILIGLTSGSADISLKDLLASLSQNNSPTVNTLVMDLRLPRVLSAFAVGGLLSVSGVLMQVLLRNPLAEPYILGSSGGAAVAALLGMSYGLSAFWIDAAAFSGALCATFLVFGIASSSGNWHDRVIGYRRPQAPNQQQSPRESRARHAPRRTHLGQTHR